MSGDEISNRVPLAGPSLRISSEASERRAREEREAQEREAEEARVREAAARAREQAEREAKQIIVRAVAPSNALYSKYEPTVRSSHFVLYPVYFTRYRYTYRPIAVEREGPRLRVRSGDFHVAVDTTPPTAELDATDIKDDNNACTEDTCAPGGGCVHTAADCDDDLPGRTHLATFENGDLDAVPQLPHSNNAGAVRTYSEEYEYDLLGNIALLRHTWNGSGWTRRYRYAYQDAPADRTNRLASTSMPGDAAAGPYSATYSYDAFGNMTSMPHLAALDWNWSDQLRRVELGGGGTAYYVYGMGGARMRKVIERNGDQKLEWIFLGPVTIFRRRRRATNLRHPHHHCIL